MRVKRRILFLFIITSFLILANRSEHIIASDANTCSPDATPPVISGTGDFVVEVGSQAHDYLEGVTADDNCGDYKLFVQSDYVNLNKVGSYPLYYFAIDPNFNATEVVVTVHVKYDITAPKLDGIEDLEFSVHDVLSDNLFLDHVTANDNRDGDVTDEISVDYSAVVPTEVGVYDVVYTVTDATGNKAEEIIQVTIYDDEAPTIELPDPMPTIEVFSTEPDWKSYITVTDNYDLNPNVVITDNNVDLNTLGEYTITFKATDSEGNETTETMTVQVVDTTDPVIVVSDEEYEVHSDEPTWADLVAVTDNYDDNVTIDIDYSSLDFSAVGTYTVTVTATDASGNESTATFEVSIMDTTDPVITVEDHSYEVYSDEPTWADLVTAADNYDETVTIDIDYSSVDFDIVGMYTVTVTATDANGNEAVDTFEVSIVDTTAPVVEVEDQTIEVFSDLPTWSNMITVTDNYDTDVTIDVDATVVDMNVLGTYTVTVTATDASGNETVVTFTITIIDTVKPEFNTIDPFTYLIGDPEIDYLEHVVVTDNYDGVISNDQVIVYTEFIDLTTDGYYPITFEVMDSSGNYNSYTTYVHVYDEDAPVFDGLENITIATGYTVDYLSGVTATDNIQNDISDKIIVDDSRVDYDTPGVYRVNYIVTDLSGNVTIKPINITIVEDTTEPVIAGTRDFTVEVNFDAPNYLEGVTVSDDFDSNVTINVDSSDVDLETVDTYDLVYTATDQDGNTVTISKTVTVQDTISPSIVGINTGGLSTEVGDSAPDYLDGVTATDNYDTDLTVEVDSSDVDLDTVGQYEVIYTVTDDAGNITSETIYIKVIDVIAPTLSGVEDKTITVGDSFDPKEGITVTDNFDAISDILVIVSGDYDVDRAGTYDITITAIDSSNNERPVTFTLTVEEAPVEDSNDVIIYTLIGLGLIALLIGSAVVVMKIKKRRQEEELE
ncbi:immunoglobulin-like domain-containing protein [Haloplasma contractile]|uniref:Cell wall associated biofilm protein n=1 Tax=Haloplasma contractile SSD-17B TaxID=1033810 RepID=F7PV27_9MOLU|nr:immunoglobulin-like domain-containing protein [Haloplasma contractile]ERJ11262.1 cell wall associated biofilm protein [Haloplasma contractile SSD-17B]